MRFKNFLNKETYWIKAAPGSPNGPYSVTVYGPETEKLKKLKKIGPPSGGKQMWVLKLTGKRGMKGDQIIEKAVEELNKKFGKKPDRFEYKDNGKYILEY